MVAAPTSAKNGGTCTAVPTGEGYICKCRLGYTGNKCELGNASFNTILLVHYLSRSLWLHAWLFVCTHIKPCVISGFRYIRWVGYKPSTYSQTCMTSMCFVFPCNFFLSSVVGSAYLLAFRIEVFFLIERLP